MENAARKLVKDSPAAALTWLQSQAPSPARASALATVAAEWAQTEPAAAMSFAEKLAPAELGRAAAMQRVFNRWADQDVDSVLRWVSHRAQAAELDPLLWYFATDTTIRYVQRKKALAGAVLISDPNLRAQALDHVVLIWARREPATAARYVEESAALCRAKYPHLQGRRCQVPETVDHLILPRKCRLRFIGGGTAR